MEEYEHRTGKKTKARTKEGEPQNVPLPHAQKRNKTMASTVSIPTGHTHTEQHKAKVIKPKIMK